MKEIKATQGNYLTQIEEVGDERIFVTALKGINLDVFAWREATLEEKEAFEKAREEKLKNQDVE